MAIAWLCQIDAALREGGAPVSLYLASHDDDRLCHLNGVTWWPALGRLPTFAYDFFDGAFGGEIVTPSGRAEIAIEGIPGFAAAMLPGARIRWWSGQRGAAWASFALRFDGLVEAQPAVRDGVAAVEFRVDDRWLDDPVLATYAGTTGAEGEAALKGQVKPMVFGAPRMAEGVLVNSIDTIIQLNDGPMQLIDMAFEDAARFAPPVADYASYAALQAATIAPGFVATCLAGGYIRHGAPGDGVLTYDVQGSNAGSDGGGQVRRAGAILKRVAARMNRLDKVDAYGLDAIDTARPWNISVQLAAQTTMRELAQALAQSINAVALVTWTGQLTVLPIELPESAVPVGTLASDGTAMPPVARVDQLGIAAPWWRTAIEAEVTHRVHANDEIRFTATLVDRGRYDAAESYREGHIVDLADGSRWLYTAVTPTTGNLPQVGSAYWSLLSGGVDLGEIGGVRTVRVPDPPPAEPAVGTLYFDGVNNQYRFEGLVITFDGVPMTFGGAPIEGPGYVYVVPDAVGNGTYTVEIVPPLTQKIYTDFLGNPLPSQFPRTLTPSVKQGGVDIRTGNQVSYSIATTGVSATVDNTTEGADKGRITVTAAEIGHILLSIFINGLPFGPYKIPFEQQSAPAPSPGGSGSTSASDSTFPNLTLASFEETAGPMTVTVGTGQDVLCSFPASYATSGGGSFERARVNGKWQSSPAGAGTWTDAGAPITGSATVWDPEFFSGNAGYGAFNQTIGGLAAGDYDIRFVASLTILDGAPNVEIFNSTATVLVQ